MSGASRGTEEVGDVTDEPTKRTEPLCEADTVGLGLAASSTELLAAAEEVGTSLGRYVVLETVGRGGMGRVLRAYDPTLQREVALKLVHTDAIDPDARDRMLREARAMARLSHPNVVAVYDVEDSEAGVVLVLEYVAGQTLSAWARAQARPWVAVVACYRRAGLGLAAAHAEGILHRDFKPANVLVSNAGEVKVTDFGIAKLAGAATSDSTSSALVPASGDSRDDMLTRAGTVLGTPLYMAPEQHCGTVMGPASDQYAFCVALWEALVGAPPFRGRGMGALLGEKLQGPPAWPASAADVPRRIVDAISRGLAAKPEQRWPSMNALLDALAHDPTRRRRHAAWLLGSLALVGTAGTTSLLLRNEPCTGAEQQLAGVWDQPRRDQVRASLLGTGTPYAEAAWQRSTEGLDRYATEWIAMHTDACEATSVRHEQSAAALDLRMGCLLRARQELVAAIGVLTTADVETVRNAQELVAALPPLSRCADVEALAADVEPPHPDEAAAVEDARARLSEARAELRAGHFAAAKARVAESRAGLLELEYGPAHVEVALQEGRVLDRLGEWQAAESALRNALRLAAQWRSYDAMRDAAAALMLVVGSHQERAAEGLRYRDLAEGLAKGDPLEEAEVRRIVATLLATEGKYVEAEAELRQALSQQEQVLGQGHPEQLKTRYTLAVILTEGGRYDEAMQEARLVLEQHEHALGPNHPQLADPLNVLAVIGTARGDHAQAEAYLRRSLALLEQELGPVNPDVALARANLAVSLQSQGKLEEAAAEHRRSLALREQLLGASHPDVAFSMANLALVLARQGKHAEAEAQLRRALVLMERLLGADHPDVAKGWLNLGVMLAKQGQLDAAEVELRRALAVQEQALAADHPDTAETRAALADVLVRAGRPEEALALAELAWTRRQRADLAPDEQAYCAFVLARALWESSRDPAQRTRARSLAEAARERYELAGSLHAADVTEVQAWLEQH